MQKDTKVLQLHFAKIAILVIFNVKGLSQKKGGYLKKRVGAISKRRAISKGFYFKKPKLATLKKSKVATLLTVEIYKFINVYYIVLKNNLPIALFQNFPDDDPVCG